MGGPPFRLLEPLFLVGAKELPFPLLLDSAGHLSTPDTLWGILAGSRLLVLIPACLPLPLPKVIGYRWISLPPQVGRPMVMESLLYTIVSLS